jgi:hypothetical protein
MIPYQICIPFGVEVIIILGTSISNILPIFILLEYLLEKVGLTIVSDNIYTLISPIEFKKTSHSFSVLKLTGLYSLL